VCINNHTAGPQTSGGDIDIEYVYKKYKDITQHSIHMNKYIVEGNLNLFEELNKSLNIEDSDADNEICLITQQCLINNYVEMTCGHKFNYIPLYLDLVNHKQKFNKMEISDNHLNPDEIRCPYCRKKQIGLLTYYEEYNLPKFHGVNFIDVSIMPICYKSCNFSDCPKIGLPINYHNGVLEGPNYGDEASYCCKHKKIIIQKYKKEQKERKNTKLIL
jgi:hypothetical protein